MLLLGARGLRNLGLVGFPPDAILIASAYPTHKTSKEKLRLFPLRSSRALSEYKLSLRPLFTFQVMSAHLLYRVLETA